MIIFDNRGIGGSDKPAGGYTTAADGGGRHAGCSTRWVSTRAHVLGVSMGGMIAQEFALAYPERVDKLLLCCTCSEPSAANSASTGSGRRRRRCWACPR